MKNENYFTVQGWMINELKLSGNELNLYALIFGFSKDDNFYHGAMQYLADSIGVTKQSTLKLLKKLVEKNYIFKFERGSKGHKNCDYKINSEIVKNICGKESLPQENLAVKKVYRLAVKKVYRKGKESLPPSGQESLPPSGQESLPPSGQESCHHNNIFKIYDQNNVYNNPRKQALELSELLLFSHRKEYPDYLSGKNENEIKKILDGWAKPIEQLIRKDKKEAEKIREVILWVKTPGNFWFSNIESGEKLRKQFERLYSQMVDQKKSTKKFIIKTDHVKSEDVRKYLSTE